MKLEESGGQKKEGRQGRKKKKGGESRTRSRKQVTASRRAGKSPTMPTRLRIHFFSRLFLILDLVLEGLLLRLGQALTALGLDAAHRENRQTRQTRVAKRR
jgi:hypothetical protein